jgi:Lon-like ATP-dependent protease
MLRAAAAAAAAAIFPVRFAAAPAVAAAEELRSPLLRVIGTLRGGRGSVLLGRRARFCSNSSASDSEAKAEDATAAEGEADSKASSAIMPTSTNIDDCLSVCSSAIRFFPFLRDSAMRSEMCYE